MDPPEKFADDLFAVPRGASRYYLYAPLRHALAVVNRDAVAVVGRYLASGEAAMDGSGRGVIETLQKHGLIGGQIPAPPVFPHDYRFCPHEVTLFPTSRCNLRCRYCYANGGDHPADMPWEIARAAIDLVARNAGLLGSPKFAVGFHGGGEPLLAWHLVRQCVEHAQRAAEDRGLKAEFFAATNGLLQPGQMEFVARYFTTVNVSLDGPPDIQDRNRPRADGGGSYAGVEKTLRYFDDVGFAYGFRATVSAATVKRSAEIVEHLATRFHPRYIHLEPLWMCGRCATSGETPPREEEFADCFLEAVAAGRARGIDIVYSGARINVLTSKFCAAAGDGFNVLPQGIVTSCYEAVDPADPKDALFQYGRYDRDSQAFAFDEDKRMRLQALAVENLEHCRDCFCKWHCAGDCLSKVFARSGRPVHEGSSRCRMNRELTLRHLDRLVAEAGATAPEEEGART